jgi:type IV pilus assembly protein PilF
MRLILTGFLVTLLILTSGCASFFAPWFPSKEKEVREDLKSEHSWLGKEQSESEKKASAVLHTQLAGAYYSRRQFKIAIDEANKALNTNPDYAPAYNVLGLIYMDLHEDKLAKENFERALEIAPKDPETHNNFGWFLCQRMPEQMDQAMKHFMAALKDSLYATPEMSNTNAGTCELSRGSYKSAERFFQQALALKPAYSQALIGMAETHFMSGNLPAARLNLLHYMRTSTPTAKSLLLGVRIERKSGNRQSAASYALQLTKRFPNSDEAADLRNGKY